ncbi:SMI1/KNR4 family protein [Lysinibacillus macroides]|uniref:SMI1/KNR4 family protein n=1 Tax=Lysinibacillus macroides TaxID=33935 RepID=UPI0006B62CCD|nr:SMI1/KNR4 family protein [Lysinibacillus macroides]QPR67877.1 SMI1/KNR4 family protein [Lysinibacillus macroides]
MAKEHDAKFCCKEWVIELYAPATVEDIQKVERKLQRVLPKVYKEFLYISNGMLGNLAKVYSTDELIEMNKAYEVQGYAANFISIGNDHGGYQLLMEATAEAVHFQLVSDGYGVPSENDVTDNFLLWLNSNEGNPWRNEKGL